MALLDPPTTFAFHRSRVATSHRDNSLHPLNNVTARVANQSAGGFVLPPIVTP